MAYLGIFKIDHDNLVFRETSHIWKNGQRGRIHEYFPSKKKPSSLIIFVTGISRDGLDDERLKKLASALAYSGKVVVMAEFTDFAAYRMKATESEKLLETIDFVKEKYPGLKYGIGAVCLGGITTLLSLTKIAHEDMPSYVYLHGVFLNHDTMVRHCVGRTPADDSPSPGHEILPPDPLGKAVILYNSDNFLTSLREPVKAKAILLDYISKVEDSDSHVEFRKYMNSLCEDDFHKVVGNIDPSIFDDIDKSSPDAFLSSFCPTRKVKFYQSHSKDDDVIPLQQGIDLFNFLKSKGANIKFVVSKIGHGGEVKNIFDQLRFFKFTIEWSNY